MKCKKCGTEYKGKFCPECGTKNRSKLHLILGVCAGLFVILLIIGALAPESNSDTSTSTTHAQTTSHSPTPNFNISDSKFYLSGGFKEGWSSKGEDVYRARFDKDGESVYVTEYTDKDKYRSESQDATTSKVIDGITVYKIPSVLTVFFEKNNKYYMVSVTNVSGWDGTQTPADDTTENEKYIENIVGSIQ